MPTINYVATPPVEGGRCYKCGLSVNWLTTLAGVRAPFDPVAVDREDDRRANYLMFEMTPGVLRVRHVSNGKRRDGDRLVRHHNVTCPERKHAGRNAARAAHNERIDR